MMRGMGKVATGLKQRLTGAFVLLVGALVLWPLIFEDPYSRQVSTKTEIPPEPAAADFDVKAPEPTRDDQPLETGRYAPVDEAAGSVPAEAPAVTSTSTVTAAAPVAATPDIAATVAPKTPAIVAPGPDKAKVADAKPAAAPAAASKPAHAEATPLDARGLPERWTVQMGSFKEESAALGLRNKLVAAGYPAYLKAIDTPKGRSFRVSVGPKVDRKSADALQQTLNQKFGTHSIVVRFEP